MQIEELAKVFKLLGDKTRLTILALLREKELCVCELVDILQTSQPNISQHMRKLKDGGLVQEEKRGQWVYYSLQAEGESIIIDLLNQLPSMQDQLHPAVCESNGCC